MKVLKKQTNSKMCIICGIENKLGLQASFYEMEDKTVISIFDYKDIHQSYPGRAHGGMITCMLDEIIGRAIWIDEPDVWGVTISLNIKFRKPTPLNQKLKAVGKIIKNNNRIFVGTGELYDMDGNLLAEAEATYMKLPASKITDEQYHEDINIYVPDDIIEI